MARPASVTVVAVLAILGSLFTLLMAALTGAVAFIRLPGMPEQPPVMRYALLFNAGLFLAVGVWGIVTAIGLLRMKAWARVSTLVFSSGLVFFAVCSIFFLFLLPVVNPPNVPDSFMRGVMIVMGAFYGVLLAVGIWWLVLFNRAAIKAQFYGGTAPLEPFPLPLSITTIAWFLLTTCVFFLPIIFTDWPASFLAWLVTGWSAKLVYLAYGVVGVAAGYGLLKRKTWAYWLTVSYFAFGLVNFVVFYGVPGSQEKLTEFTRAMSPQGMNSDLPHISPLAGALIGLLTAGLPLYFLLTRKKRYYAACQANSPVSPASQQG